MNRVTLLEGDISGQEVDAVIKCQIDQVEKFVPVGIDIPGVAAGRQSVQIQVPQLVSWRLHERFRWPVDQVLLISCGIVAAPAPGRPRGKRGAPQSTFRRFPPCRCS